METVKEIGVGIRIDPDHGLSFNGIEEVNALINCGGKVTSVEPGGVLMRKIGEDGDDVSLTLSGCELKVMVDDTEVEESPQRIEHNRLFQEGSELIRPYMQITDRETKSSGSNDAQDDLEQGISLLQQAIEINPANWSAYWIIGKAYQSLGNSTSAFEAFGRSFALHKDNADVAREYMFECLNVGEAEKGISAARHALRVKPEDAGLVANLALALLINAELDEAATTVDQSLTLVPGDRISQNLKRVIDDVKSGRRPQPATLAELE